MSVSEPVANADDADALRLAELGYKQELHRGMSGFSNFAVSFSIISVLAGCITTYYLAMDAGGPLAISLGWPVVGLFVLCVALAMAEVCSAYPTAGGLYFWAGRVARRNKRVWAWYVGWFNFLGEVAVTAAIDYGAAVTWMAMLNLIWGVSVSPTSVFVAYVVILLLHGILNTFGVSLVRLLSDVSAWWHLAGVVVIVAVLAIAPDHHKPVSEVFFEVRNTTGFSFAGAGIYAVLIGLLMAQYTYTGYDASAHVAEETHDAATAAPRGIVMSVVVSVVAGFFLLFAITWSIQDYDGERTTALGLPPAQIFIDAAGHDLGAFLLFICVIAQLFCGMASVTANSRMAFAFARDGALPGSRIWKKVNPRTGTPTNSIWLCVTISTILVAPSLWNSTAFAAATSIAVIGLYIAYVGPVLLRRLNSDFVPGPWSLGKWSAPIGWVAIVWVAVICVLFILPTAGPVTAANFNYTILAVAIVVGGATIWWFASARKWFTGPKQNLIEKAAHGEQTLPAGE
jgi:amino acid permease (GABA permease)